MPEGPESHDHNLLDPPACFGLEDRVEVAYRRQDQIDALFDFWKRLTLGDGYRLQRKHVAQMLVRYSYAEIADAFEIASERLYVNLRPSGVVPYVWAILRNRAEGQ